MNKSYQQLLRDAAEEHWKVFKNANPPVGQNENNQEEKKEYFIYGFIQGHELSFIKNRSNLENLINSADVVVRYYSPNINGNVPCAFLNLMSAIEKVRSR